MADNRICTTGSPLVDDVRARKQTALGHGRRRAGAAPARARQAAGAGAARLLRRRGLLRRVRPARRLDGPDPGRPRVAGRRRVRHRDRRDRRAASGRDRLRLHRDGRLHGAGRRAEDDADARARAAPAHPDRVAARLRPARGSSRRPARRSPAWARCSASRSRCPVSCPRSVRCSGTARPAPRTSPRSPTSCRWSRASSSMALGGRHLVKAATGEDVTEEEMGGSEVHTKVSGVADLEVASDDECLAIVRHYLSFFPTTTRAGPPSSDRRSGRPALRDALRHRADGAASRLRRPQGGRGGRRRRRLLRDEAAWARNLVTASRPRRRRHPSASSPTSRWCSVARST